MTREAAWFVSHDDHFSSDKAIKQLDYTPPDLKTVIRDAVAWQAQQGIVSASGQPALPLTQTADMEKMRPPPAPKSVINPPKGQKVRHFSKKPAQL